ncbi:MAG: hypothetical protein ACREMQ_11950, partial [Longimicrobiales bacterium]
ENDARGWFFLQHVSAWNKFNQTEGNPFRGKVDLGNVALIGHSRGGEAVGHAAAFNRLTHYPDDANFTFDFGFGIKAIIAIAPVDGQYRPAEQLVPVKNVNYLVFHGSHDGDVSAFMGIRQYQRVTFTDGSPHFKAAVFVYRANHGQWNTVWGAHDNGPRSARILDLRSLIPAEDQRRFGKVYITAFLEAALKGESRYLPIFRDHRAAGEWLPKTMYITRFEDDSFRPIASFEEDIDVTTGGAGVKLMGDSLATWKETRLQLRTTNSPSEGTSQYNNAVWLGWNNRIAGDDTTRMGRPASFTVTLPDAYAEQQRLGDSSLLQFLLMPTADLPGPRKATAADSSAGKTATARERKTDNEQKPPVDLSIEVVDASGVSAKVPLSRYGIVRRPLEAWILMRRDVERARFGSMSEIVLQTYSIPLQSFKAEAPALNLARLKQVRFVFDRAVAGTVIVDDIGFAHTNPAFWRPVTEQERGTR